MTIQLTNRQKALLRRGEYKPHIVFSGRSGDWACYTWRPDSAGIGRTPREAYRAWLKRVTEPR